MEDSIRISPENSLALTEGQEGELVSTVRPCSGSSISGQVSPCNTKAHFKAQSLTLQCMCRREKNRNLSPCSINVSPTAILQGLTEKAPSTSLQLHTDSKLVWAKVSHLLKVFSGTFIRATSMQPASALKRRFPHIAF